MAHLGHFLAFFIENASPMLCPRLSNIPQMKQGRVMANRVQIMALFFFSVGFSYFSLGGGGGCTTTISPFFFPPSNWLSLKRSNTPSPGQADGRSVTFPFPLTRQDYFFLTCVTRQCHPLQPPLSSPSPNQPINSPPNQPCHPTVLVEPPTFRLRWGGLFSHTLPHWGRGM